jgi:hypothetical protein
MADPCVEQLFATLHGLFCRKVERHAADEGEEVS